MNLTALFDKTQDSERHDFVRNEIIERISDLSVSCPECENIIHDDDQYQCGTCGGSARIHVLNWIKERVANAVQQRQIKARMTLAAQQYALKVCQADMSKLTDITLAWEDGFKTCYENMLNESIK